MVPGTTAALLCRFAAVADSGGGGRGASASAAPRTVAASESMPSGGAGTLAGVQNPNSEPRPDNRSSLIGTVKVRAGCGPGGTACSDAGMFHASPAR